MEIQRVDLGSTVSTFSVGGSSANIGGADVNMLDAMMSKAVAMGKEHEVRQKAISETKITNAADLVKMNHMVSDRTKEVNIISNMVGKVSSGLQKVLTQQ